MPVLENQKYELFAQALASGSSADEAYQRAGYAAHRGNASRLSANESVMRRVAELQSRVAADLNVTLQWLIEKAEEARQGAMAAGQHSAAVAAIKELGVLSGRRIEKRETGQPGEFEGLGLDELRASVAREIGVDAESLKAARLARKQAGVRRELH